MTESLRLCTWPLTFPRTYLLLVSQAQYIFIHDALMEYVTCGDTEFVVRELPEKLRILNTIDPDSGDSLLVAEFKVWGGPVVKSCVW